MIDLLKTSKGWLLRQVLKLSGVAGVWLATTLEKAGAGDIDETKVGAAIGLIAAGLLEIALSYATKKANE